MTKRESHDGLIAALLCVVCGLGAVVRVQDQGFCARCAIDYQQSRLDSGRVTSGAATSGASNPSRS